MKRFSEYQQRAMRPLEAWKTRYVDYDFLKAVIWSFSERRIHLDKLQAMHISVTDEQLKWIHIKDDSIEPGSYRKMEDREKLTRRDVNRKLNRMERLEFMALVDREVHKSASFFSEEIYRNTGYLSREQDSITVKEENESEEEPVFATIGREIIELKCFVVVNLITLRQILIRYDEFVSTFNGKPLSQWYVRTLTSNDGCSPPSSPPLECPFEKVFHLGRLYWLESCFKIYLQELEILYSSRKPPTSNENDQSSEHPNSYMYAYRQEFCSISREFEVPMQLSLFTLEEATTSRVMLRDHLTSKLRGYFLLGSMGMNLSLEPQFFGSTRRKSLKEEMRGLARWREIDIPDHHENEDDVTIESKIGKENIFPLVMSLIGSFLHVMNFYIVKPTSTKYVLVLGGDVALSSVLIGAMPWASLFSSVIYSIWTNHSYKQPIIISGILVTTGNFLYASAYLHHSFSRVLFGCALVGFGAPSMIHRRFLGEKTPVELRTMANAAFAATMAAGSAIGPAVAVAFDSVRHMINFPQGSKIYINGLTGPGYLMMCLWFVYTLLMACFFKEPIVRGLPSNKPSTKPIVSNNSFDQIPSKNKTDISPQKVGFKPKSISTRSFLEHRLELKAEHVQSPSQNIHPISIPSFTSHHVELDSISGSLSSDYYIDIEFQTDSNKPSQDILQSRQKKIMTFIISMRSFLSKNAATVTILCLVFVSSYILETLESSAAVLTRSRYQWPVKDVGALQTTWGALVIPISILIGYFSHLCPDRLLVTWLIPISTTAVLMLLDVTDWFYVRGNKYNNQRYNEGMALAVGPERYITGSLIIFITLHACESVAASMLSKMISPEMARGTLNSSFLATVFSTFGRGCGDIFIFIAASINLRLLMNLIFIPSFVMLLMCFYFLRRNYDSLNV